MAELATIARPYAEALFKAVGSDNAATLSQQVDALSAVASHAEVRQFADSPKIQPKQVFDLVSGVAKVPLSPKVVNLLNTVIENGRLGVLPEIAAQFHTLVNANSGISDAKISSAFPLDAGQLAETVSTLEKRFGRKLNASVEIDETLIGGIRVVVGDEVLDSSIKARLEQMKAALTS